MNKISDIASLEKDFIDNIFEDFISLSGDRFYGEDQSVICGFAKFESKSVLKSVSISVMGTQNRHNVRLLHACSNFSNYLHKIL